MPDDFFSPPKADITSDLEIPYAGFWRRVIASFVDFFILWLLAFLGLRLDDGRIESVFKAMDSSSWTGFVIIYLVPVGITVFFWMVFKATPGKMVMGCQIVNAKTGEKLGFGRSLVRYCGYYIALIPLGLGAFWIIFSKRKQGWHDLIAGTVVIQKRN